MIRIVVDLNKCESYAQCVFSAPTVFWMNEGESLEYDYEPDDSLRVPVQRAAAACPVQAIRFYRIEEMQRHSGKTENE